jgi:hypothetical protein
VTRAGFAILGRMGKLGLFAGLLLVGALALSACSSSDDNGRNSPDGGASGGATSSGGSGTGGGKSGGSGGRSNGGASGGNAGTPSSGGAPGGGTGGDGSGGQAAACDPGCTQNCEQGCFDVPDCKAAGGATLSVRGSIYTAGVTATGVAGAESVELLYRKTGASFWSKGQDLNRLPDGRSAGVMFYLSADTTYDVRVQSGSTVACGTVQTLAAALSPTHTGEVWVDAAASAGGDGSQAKPFLTIQAGVNAAKAGTDVRVRAGTYREQVTITTKATGDAFVRVIGEDGVVLDGSDTRSKPGDLPWRDDGGGVYSVEWPGDPRYVSRDGKRL